MKLSKVGIDLIKEFEGFRKDAYQDVVGIWTIGYGTIKYKDGTPVKKGDSITPEKATEELTHHIEEFIGPVLTPKNVTVQLTQNQIDAIGSFIYNLGAGAFLKSTLLKMINAKDFSGAALQFLKWNKAGGKEFAGLTRRRQAEMDLFKKK